jgi:hypothetical protein
LVGCAAETVHCVAAVVAGDADARVGVEGAADAVGRHIDAGESSGVQVLSCTTSLGDDALTVLELVLGAVACDAETQVVNEEAVGGPLDAVALDGGFVTQASSGLVSQRADSSEVLEPSVLALVAVSSDQVVRFAVYLSINAGSETEGESGSAA